MNNGEIEEQKLARLQALMIRHFNLQEVRLLYLDLHYDPLTTAGRRKSARIQVLIDHARELGELQMLIDEVSKRRPSINWPDFMPMADDIAIEVSNKRQTDSGGQDAGDRITTGDIDDVSGAAIGESAQGLSAGNVTGSIIQSQGNVILGSTKRDEQYEIALNWQARGKPRLREFELSGRDLSGLDLVGADLTGARLRGAKLAESNLNQAVLSGADLEDANLWHVRLVGARLHRVILDHANLVDADLTGAQIVGRSLHGANLKRAILRNAEVAATVVNADLSDANLQGADLSQVPDLWRALSLAGVRYDKATKWPRGFDPEAAGAIFVASSPI